MVLKRETSTQCATRTANFRRPTRSHVPVAAKVSLVRPEGMYIREVRRTDGVTCCSSVHPSIEERKKQTEKKYLVQELLIMCSLGYDLYSRYDRRVFVALGFCPPPPRQELPDLVEHHHHRSVIGIGEAICSLPTLTRGDGPEPSIGIRMCLGGRQSLGRPCWPSSTEQYRHTC